MASTSDTNGPSGPSDTIEYPWVPERITFRTTTRQTGGDILEFEDVILATGGRGGPPEHLHPHLQERFEVLAGLMGVRIAGHERVLHAGEQVVVPPGTPHTFWREGQDELRQITQFRPAGQMEAFFRITAGLAKDRKTNVQGYPNLLHVAVLAQMFRGDMVLTQPPRIVQQIVFGALAPLGRLLGYQKGYAKYLAPHGARQATTTRVRGTSAAE
jgi:mannose-6-phosphate isomerase-like protein (cupin superfamily)